jgi:hypothetical protein
MEGNGRQWRAMEGNGGQWRVTEGKEGHGVKRDQEGRGRKSRLIVRTLIRQRIVCNYLETGYPCCLICPGHPRRYYLN